MVEQGKWWLEKDLMELATTTQGLDHDITGVDPQTDDIADIASGTDKVRV